MEKRMKRIISLVLIAVLAMSFVPASAAFSSFPDVSGHWAESYLEKAYADGLIEGFDDGKMYPDAPVSYIQVLTLICRMLSPLNRTPYAQIGLTGQEWYAEYAAQASAMGLPVKANDPDISRMEAFKLLLQAFQLREAFPKLTALNQYTDVNMTEYRRNSYNLDILAVLVNNGYIEGYDNKLHLDKPLTRAEFVTILYRFVSNYSLADEVQNNPYGGTVISGSAQLSNKTFTDPVFLDCTTDNISLSGVTAGTLVVRSQRTGTVSVSNGTKIDRLVLAGGIGTAVTFAPNANCSIGTLVIGDFDGDLTINGNTIGNIEVIGDLLGNDQSINLTGTVQKIDVSGLKNVVSADSGTALKELKFSPSSIGNSVTLNRDVTDITMDGETNTVTANRSVSFLDLYGKWNNVKGSGTIKTVSMYTTQSSVNMHYDREIDNRDYGIERAVVNLSAPVVLPVGETLTVTASFTNEYERLCTAVWYLNGSEVRREPVTVGRGQTLSYSTTFEYSEDMATTATVKCEILYTTTDGNSQTASGTALVALENYDEEYYAQYNRENVLATVSSTYLGDWTTEWAEQNDYDERTKTIWINAKGYSSSTEYLIWINRAYQRVNIFQGSAGNWDLIHTYLCGTGSLSTPTPVGVYTVWARSAAGWTTGTYNVRPVVNFRVGSGYAFHSRLYNPGHNYLTDPSIGFPVSHGCIRMYDEDVQWIYDNIPNNTSVVVF